MLVDMNTILSRCNLLQYEGTLRQAGFDSWDQLRLLETSDYRLDQKLQEIPFGRFKQLVDAIKKYAAEKKKGADRGSKKVHAKYNVLMKKMKRIPDFHVTFGNLDNQWSKYEKMRQQYKEQWALKKQYENNIRQFIERKGNRPPLSTEKVKDCISTLEGLVRSLQQFWPKMGDIAWNPLEQIDLTGSEDVKKEQQQPLIRKQRASASNMKYVQFMHLV